MKEEPEDTRTPAEIEFDQHQLRIMQPSRKAALTKGSVLSGTHSRTTLVELHDKFCYLICGGLGYKDAYRLAGYAIGEDWAQNALKCLKQERTQNKLRRFRGGDYPSPSRIGTGITPETIMENLQKLAVKAETYTHLSVARDIYVLMGQQYHGMFLQSKQKPGSGIADLAAALGSATAKEIEDQLRILDEEAGSVAAAEEEDDSSVN
jgi:hypothetical protein